jgi:hypothetical protein
LTATAASPEFASNRTLHLIGSGWRLSAIYKRTTDTFLSATSGVDRQLSDIASQRPDQVKANIYKDKSKGPLSQYLDPTAFALPALGSLGNLGRLNIAAPGTWQFDMALSRVFAFRERQSLEFRVEAYNVTNSFRPGNPNVAFNNNTFGQIRTALDPRITQFALKSTPNWVIYSSKSLSACSHCGIQWRKWMPTFLARISFQLAMTFTGSRSKGNEIKAWR